jgi:hypothetical protein
MRYLAEFYYWSQSITKIVTLCTEELCESVKDLALIGLLETEPSPDCIIIEDIESLWLLGISPYL